MNRPTPSVIPSLIPSILSLCALASCGTDSPARTEANQDDRLPLSGTVFRMGSTDSLASPEEAPGWVRFAHDVWMDSTEMTQSEYTSLVGRNPSTTKGDRLPVTDVTWYDAILAANARSRRDGLDTVYEHGTVRRDGSGNVVGIEALSTYLDRSGWRLPTEAEWEAAARASTDTPWPWGSIQDSSKADSYAWSQRNSGGMIQPVATRSANAWGLYDMAGNAMEWVHDWKGPFPRDTVEGFAGQEFPAEVAEVPLKGGAYVYGLLQLRPSTRTATYAAYRSSRAQYVGFRLARGGFRSRTLGSGGAVVDVPPVTLVRSDLPRLLGAWEVRLVFVNRTKGKGTLTWIDYGESNPVARSLRDSLPVFHPAISPDGRWVAWSTAMEGSTGPSRIRVRRLERNDTVVRDLGEGAIPRWWVSGSDTFLVRASALDNMSPDWSATRTTARRWVGGALSGAEESWSSSGSYHDGRSGPYLYTGYRRLRQLDTRAGSDRILFTGPGNGKGAGDTSQVCNVSASPDGSGRSLFLDFGYAETSTLVGRPYGIHEVGFVSDSTGRIVGQIPAPIGERQWEHLEWSNSPRWAVSGAIDGTGAYSNLYVVDLDSARSERIVAGEELWQPSLWVGTMVGSRDGAEPDSAARYMSGEFEVRGPEFWLRRDRIDAVFLGSSHMANGMLPTRLRSVRGQLLAFAGAGPFSQDELARKYVEPHVSGLRVLVLTLMPGWLFQPVEMPSRDPWFVWRDTPGGIYDRNHDHWKNGLPVGFETMAAMRLAAAQERDLYDTSGGMVKRPASSGWGADVPSVSPIADQDTSNPDFARNMEILERLVADFTARGIVVVMVKFPESPAYARSPIATRYGPTWNVYRGIVARVRNWESTYQGFHFLDAYLDGKHDYPSSGAMNTDHLNLEGAALFSDRFDGFLDSVLAGRAP